jgi:hypothetical protein
MAMTLVEIDPNTVKPGWVALLIVLALGGATVLLWRNMGKQLKKIDFDPADGADVPPETADPSSAAKPTEATAPVTDSSEQATDSSGRATGRVGPATDR